MNRPKIKTSLRMWTPLIISLLLLSFVWISCQKVSDAILAPENDIQNETALYKGPPDIQRVMEVQNRYTGRLLARNNVVGTATGVNENGEFIVKIFTKKAGVEGLPNELDGVSVFVETRGEIHAQSYTGEYPLPVPIGVSCGNLMDPYRTGYITAGTIGCAVEKTVTIGKGKNAQTKLQRYILSNNHVLAQENKGKTGDPIVQPGTYDMWNPTGHEVASLSEFMKISFARKYPAPTYPVNYMDAAIASSYGDEISGWYVNTTVPVDAGEWAITATPASAYLGQPVMKCGRTTEVTQGMVTAVNVNIIVAYGASPTYKYAYFANQIETSTLQPNDPFSDSGDSGSLVVTDPGHDPIGLHFAGGVDAETDIAYGFSSPIQVVLNAFKVSIAE